MTKNDKKGKSPPTTVKLHRQKMINLHLQGMSLSEAARKVGTSNSYLFPHEREFLKKRIQELEDARKRVAATISSMVGSVIVKQVKEGVIEETIQKQKGKPDIVTIKKRPVSITEWDEFA